MTTVAHDDYLRERDEASAQLDADLERLVLSRRTVDPHVSAILRKLDAHTRGEAAAAAARLGLRK